MGSKPKVTQLVRKGSVINIHLGTVAENSVCSKICAYFFLAVKLDYISQLSS